MVNIPNISNVTHTDLQFVANMSDTIYSCHAIPKATNGRLMFIYDSDVWVGSYNI